MTPKEQIKDIVENGLISQIIYAESGYNLWREIGLFAKEINQNNLGNLFSYFQSISYHEIVLSVTKLYEPTKRHFKIRSIPAIIQIVAENISNLEIIEKYNFCKTKFMAGCQDLDGLSNIELNNLFVIRAQETLPSSSFKTITELSHSLSKLKVQRDKSIAHNEVLDISSCKVSFKEIVDLIEYAKRFVGAVGWGYLSTVFEIDGEYIISNRSKIIPFELKKLLTNNHDREFL